MDPKRPSEPSDEPDAAVEEIKHADDLDTGDQAFESEADGEILVDAGEIELAGADASREFAGAETELLAPESIDAGSSSSILPLLDEAGNLPADFDSLHRALRRWESFAADAAGDPQFTPKPTPKPREELLMIDRGPTVPVVFLDRATMQPVVYAPETDSTSPLHVPLPPEDERGEMDLNAGRIRTPLVVTMDRAPQHFQHAFEVRAEKWIRLMTAICNDRISDYQHHQASLDRAIFGQF